MRLALAPYSVGGLPPVLNSRFAPDVYLEGAATRQTSLSREHQGPRAVLNALERLATAYGSDCNHVRQDLNIAEAQLRDYQARLGKPFTLEGYQSELTALRDQLKAGLSSTAHEPDKEEGPSVSELAERIKAIKAGNCIDATPQRVRQKHSTAEEPITARIRRRADASPALHSASAADTADESSELPPSESMHETLSKPMTMQERVLHERQQNGQQRHDDVWLGSGA